MHARGRRSATLVAGFLLFLGTSEVSAQQRSESETTWTASRTYLPLDSFGNFPAPLRRPVTIQGNDLLLKSALSEIARQARLGISYGEEFDRSQTRVSINLEAAEAGVAMKRLVWGTPWRILYTSQGTVMVVARETAPAVEEARGRITGVVRGPVGTPVAGARISVEGASESVVSGPDGSYAIGSLAAGRYRIQASSLGYVPGTRETRVTPGATARVDISLDAGVIELEELVGIGYGSARRRDLTGSIVSVRPNIVGATPTAASGIGGTMLGRVSGLQVVSNPGVPGASAQIQIRGSNSITARAEPLYIIDGTPLSPNLTPLSTVDPTNIESVQILKDASATAIYGARGANGVVIITTSRGTRGANQVTVQSSYGLQKPSKFIEALNSREFRTLVNEGLVNAGFAAKYSPSEIANAPYFDYPRALLHDLEWQPQQSHTLTLSGGSAQTRYLLSGSYLQQKGIVVNSGFSRFGARLNLDQEVSSRFRIGASLSGTRSIQRVNGAESSGNNVGTGITGLTSAVMYDPAVLPQDPVTGEWNQRVVLSENFSNPYTETLHRNNPNFTTGFLTGIHSEFDIADGLLFRSTLGGNFTFTRQASYSPSFIASGANVGVASQTSSERRELTSDNTVTLRRNVGPGVLDAMVGASIQTSHLESFSAEARGFAVDVTGYYNLESGSQLIAPSSAQTNWVLLSQLGRINYNLLDRYLFTLTGRRDGSSRFGANNKWAFFPSAAFAWRISDEPFLRGQRAFDDLKLRMSYGRTGNQAVEEYQSLARLTSAFIALGTNSDEVVLVPETSAPNPDLKWETQDQFNIGLDVSLLDNRVNAALDVYQSNTSNLLITRMLPWTTGYVDQLQNVGALRNRGIELSVRTINVETGMFTWETSLNVSANRNQVTRLYGGLQSLAAGSATQVGEPLNTFVGFKVLGLYQQGDYCELLVYSECAPGEYKILDADRNGIIDNDDRVNLGSPEADFYGGFNSNLSYGPLSLDAHFSFSVGNEINNSSMRYLGLVGGASNERRDRSLRRWTPTNTNTDVPRANLLRPNNRTYGTYIEDGSFLRLQTLTLGYLLPSRLIPGASDARVVLTGQNVWITTRYSGYDPQNQAQDAGGYPRARVWSAGFEFGF